MQQSVTHERIAQAVNNNAVWCDTVCRSHGRPGEFWDEIWLHRHEPLPFYPNAVTLTAAEGSAAQLAHIRNLIEAELPGEWGVKDSYASLELGPSGFRLLFEAEWIWRPALLSRPDSRAAGIKWGQVKNASELAEWEAAWRGGPADTPSGVQSRIFLPALLADDHIAILAAYQAGRIIAGVIANRTGEVVGMSNVFIPAHDGTGFRAGCVAAVMAAFPGLPLVGYEMGEDLAAFQALGFERLGPLRVWLRADEAM